MQFMEIAYGIATSTEIAYFTYIYAKVGKQHVQTYSSFQHLPFKIEPLRPRMQKLVFSFDAYYCSGYS